MNALVMSTWAQETSPTEADSLQEIVVVANHREQNQQDVGIAVTALSAQTLSNLGIKNTTQLTEITPGLLFTSANSGSNVALVSIRGVAQNDFAGHIESANAFYVDEIYQPSTSMGVQQGYDINRIEVLKGPQGTLFGRNSTGGLIQVITNQPTMEFGGFGRVSYGNYDHVTAEAALNVPLSARVAVRVSGLSSTADGWTKNFDGAPSNADKTRAGRVTLLMRLTDDLKILLSGDTYRILPVAAGAIYVGSAAARPDGLGVPLPYGTPNGLGFVEPSSDPFTVDVKFPGLLKRTVNNGSAKIYYDFGGVQMESITSFQSLDAQQFSDTDGSPLNFALFKQLEKTNTATQDLRLSGGRDRFNWTTGVYVLNIQGHHHQGFDLGPLGTDLEALYRVDTRSYSIFGQSEYRLRDDLTLVTGLRWTSDTKKYNYLRTCTSTQDLCPGFTLPGSIGDSGQIFDKHTEGNWSGRLELEYKPLDALLLYASANRGYKGFNYNAGFFGGAPLSAVRYRGEELMAYEAGNKLDFWQGRGRFNAAVYYYDYRNYQAFDQRGLLFTLYNSNARNYGADAELSLRPGWGTTLSAGMALLHTGVDNVPIGTQLLSREAPQSPALTVDIAAVKDATFSFGTIKGSMSAAYTGRYYSQLSNAPDTHMPSNWVVNTRLGYTVPSGSVEIAGVVTNLLDARRWVYGFDLGGPPFGLYHKSVAPPRMYGVEMRVNF